MIMKNYGQSVEINHNQSWPYIPGRRYRIWIIGGSGSGKNNALLKFIKSQLTDIEKIYLYTKDPFESMYELFIHGREKVETKKLKNVS